MRHIRFFIILALAFSAVACDPEPEPEQVGNIALEDTGEPEAPTAEALPACCYCDPAEGQVCITGDVAISPAACHQFAQAIGVCTQWLECEPVDGKPMCEPYC